MTALLEHMCGQEKLWHAVPLKTDVALERVSCRLSVETKFHAFIQKSPLLLKLKLRVLTNGCIGLIKFDMHAQSTYFL